MRYTVAGEDHGFFLGVFEKYAVFAKTDIFGLTKAASFHSESEANRFIENNLGDENDEWLVIGIKSNQKYIDLIDLIRDGHHAYTHQMMDGLEMVSEAVH